MPRDYVYDHGFSEERTRLASIESLRDAVVDAGLLSREDGDTAAARFAENRRVPTPMRMTRIDRC